MSDENPTPVFKPTIIVNPTVRQIIYALYSVGSLVASYLGGRGIIGEPELSAWAGVGVLVSSLAVAKTDTSREVKPKKPAGPAPVAAPVEEPNDATPPA